MLFPQYHCKVREGEKALSMESVLVQSRNLTYSSMVVAILRLVVVIGITITEIMYPSSLRAHL